MGLCHEFGSQINAGCDHPMRAGASACSCPECGVVCQGLFDGCADVWARGPRPVTIAATRAVSGAGPAARLAAKPADPPEDKGRPAQLAAAAPRRANGNRGGIRARVQSAASYGKTDLPAPEPGEADPRREMFRWFEEAFVGVRSDLQTLIASMTHQQAMLAELIDNRQAELRLVLAAETLPDIVADAVATAMSAHTDAMTESFSDALGTFREEMDKTQAGTAATVDSLRDTFDTFLNALAVHDEGAEKREAARLRTVKGSITRQLAPLAEAVALLNAQAEGFPPVPPPGGSGRQASCRRGGRRRRRRRRARRAGGATCRAGASARVPSPSGRHRLQGASTPLASGGHRSPGQIGPGQAGRGQTGPRGLGTAAGATRCHRPRREGAPRDGDDTAGRPDQADPQDGRRPVAPAPHDPQLPQQALTRYSSMSTALGVNEASWKASR